MNLLINFKLFGVLTVWLGINIISSICDQTVINLESNQEVNRSMTNILAKLSRGNLYEKKAALRNDSRPSVIKSKSIKKKGRSAKRGHKSSISTIKLTQVSNSTKIGPGRTIPVRGIKSHLPNNVQASATTTHPSNISDISTSKTITVSEIITDTTSNEPQNLTLEKFPVESDSLQMGLKKAKRRKIGRRGKNQLRTIGTGRSVKSLKQGCGRHQPKCNCRTRHVVCGSDSRTYASECQLLCYTKCNPGLTLVGHGYCSDGPGGDLDVIYAPEILDG